MAFLETMRKKLTGIFSGGAPASTDSRPQRIFLVMEPWSWGDNYRFHFIRGASTDAINKTMPSRVHQSDRPRAYEIEIYSNLKNYDAAEGQRALIRKTKLLNHIQRETLGLTDEKIAEMEKELARMAAEGTDEAALSTVYPVVKETESPGSDSHGDWLDILLEIAGIFTSESEASLYKDRMNQQNTGNGKYVVRTYPVWERYAQSAHHYADQERARREQARQDSNAAQKAQALASFTPEELAALNIQGGAAVAPQPDSSLTPANPAAPKDFENVVAQIQGKNPGAPAPKI